MLPDGYSDVADGKLAAVVTSLEMTARPALRPEAPGAWSIRTADRPEPTWYRDLFDRVGRDWLWVSRKLLGDAELSAIIHAEGVVVHALVADGRDEGLLELDFREPDTCEIVFFGVTPSQVGGGGARFLMNRAIDIAWSRPIKRLWLHTCTLDHPKAPAFYQRSGFRAFRRQVEIIDDPRVSGLVPRDTAPQVPIIG